MVVAVVAEAARAKKEAVVEGEPTIVALAKAMPASHAAAFIAGKMGECEANSVHLSKREKFLAEQGKKA
ncbi:hypothetical protein JL721_2617 [Aureococcus anophagefferens]|nr:hypothetical protein JL721_2617 [Aureococcus anophagefferens]